MDKLLSKFHRYQLFVMMKQMMNKIDFIEVFTK